MSEENRRSNYYLKIFEKNKLLLIINFLLTLLKAAGSAAIALILRKIIDIAVTGDINKFYKALILDICYLAVFALVYYFNSVLGKLLIKRVVRKLRQSIFEGIFHRTYQDFFKVNTADYISVLTNDIKLIEENYLQPVMIIVENILLFLFTLALLIDISPVITLILFIGLLGMFFIPALIGKRLQKRQEVLSEGYSVFTTKIKDMFSGFEVIKAFLIFPYIKKQFSDENELLITKKYKADKLFVLNETVSQFMAIFSQIFTIFAASYLVMKGSITIGTLIAVIQLSGSFMMPLLQILQNFPRIQSISPIIKRIEEFDDFTIEEYKGNCKPNFEKSINFSNVSFAYQEEQQVLSNIHLKIEKGKKYAIVGESGCGKSTLVKLIMGYHSNFTGEIFYDGIPMQECDFNAISSIASMIHQNVFLFDQTIKENICLFQDYPKETINDALNKSGVNKFLPSMPKRLDTLVGENGANLSGGQRQRIAIARALIKSTPLLILDEATSALDQQTASDIELGLLHNKQLTLVTITHKLSKEILELYDQIIFMEKGHIVEAGSYDQLYSAGKSFYNFCVA